VLADAGITNLKWEVKLVTTDGYYHESYTVTLQDVIDDAYLVTYLVNGNPITAESTTIYIYRNHDDASTWLNRARDIGGVEVTSTDPILADPPELDWTFYRNDDGSGLPWANVFCVTPDLEGGLWVGTNGGGAAYRDAEGQWTVYTKANSPLTHDMIIAIEVDEMGGVWFAGGSPWDGLGIIHKVGDQWTRYINEDFDQPEAFNFTMDIAMDDNGGAWFATDVGPVYRDSNGDWHFYDDEDYEFPSRYTTVVTLDDQGGVWFGFRASGGPAGGYAYLDAEGNVTSYEITGDGSWIRSISVDQNGGVWIVRLGKVDYIASNGERTVYENCRELLPFLSETDTIQVIKADNEGGLWFGSSESGLYYRDREGKFTVFNRTNTWPIPSFDSIWFVDVCKNGHLLVGTNGGVAITPPYTAVHPDLAVFTVSGDGVTGGEKSYTLTQLKVMGEITRKYTASGVEADCTGVLLADVLADAGVTNSTWEVDVTTTDNYPYGTVTLQEAMDQAYMVTYLVDGEPFEDFPKDSSYDSSTIRIYRNFNDGSNWRNRLTMVCGVEVTEVIAPTAYVSTKGELDAALGESGISTIVFESSISADIQADRLINLNFSAFTLNGNVEFITNAEGEMAFTGSADPAITGNLTVNTPNATVSNSVKVGGTVIINEIAGSTWNENADGNDLLINLQGGSATVIINSNVNNLIVNGAGDGLNVIIHGSVNNAVFNAPTKVEGGNNIKSATITAEGCEFDQAPQEYTHTVDIKIGDEIVSPPVVGDPDKVVFTLSGHGVPGGKVEFTLADLRSLGEMHRRFSYRERNQVVTDWCTGVLLADLLAGYGITDDDLRLDMMAEPGRSSGRVTLKEAVEQGYFVTYLVDGEPFEDTQGKRSSTIRIYRNFDRGNSLQNLITMVTGVNVTYVGPPSNVKVPPVGGPPQR
jgi:hypothetical protein